jgi:hypothetical protein
MPATKREIEFAESLEIHHNKLIGKVDVLLAKLKASHNRHNHKLVGPQIDYWERVRSGLKWSTALAKQKAGRK